MHISSSPFNPIHFMVTPLEWPTAITTRLCHRHPVLFQENTPQEANEDFFRRLLSSVAIDFETKHRVLRRLPLSHSIQGDMLKQTMEEGQRSIISHLENTPESTLRMTAMNIASTFGLLDLWKIGFDSIDEETMIKSIMARKFIKHPTTVNILRNMSLDDHLVRKTFQPLLDTAEVYENCRQPITHIEQEK